MAYIWKIKYYQSPSGNEPVYRFIESLPIKTKAKIYNTFELLLEYGIQLGLPHVKKLASTPLWELRILGTNNIRVMYVALTEKTFLFLHGCIKKKQKTPIKDITTAVARFREYMARY